LAEKRRQRAALLGLLVRNGGAEASKAGAILRCRHGGLVVTKGAKGERQAALMRLAKLIKREGAGRSQARTPAFGSRAPGGNALYTVRPQ
jgi:hypothetical protein